MSNIPSTGDICTVRCASPLNSSRTAFSFRFNTANWLSRQYNTLSFSQWDNSNVDSPQPEQLKYVKFGEADKSNCPILQGAMLNVSNKGAFSENEDKDGVLNRTYSSFVFGLKSNFSNPSRFSQSKRTRFVLWLKSISFIISPRSKGISKICKLWKNSTPFIERIYQKP